MKASSAVAEIPTIDIPELYSVEAPAVPKGVEPVKRTIRRMADVLTGTDRNPPERPTVDVMAAFDRGSKGATLDLGDEAAPIWPKNPVPSGSSRKGTTYQPKQRTGGRPPGAEDLQGLFATGIILLIAFSLGEDFQMTEEEALAVSGPLANIVARRIDLAAKLGKDASDTIALAVALLSYLARVGPVAAGRVRENVQQRQRRTVSPPPRPLDSRGEDSVAAGEVYGTNPADGPAYRPFDALAKASRNGLEQLDRDFGYAPNSGPAVGSNG